MRRLGRLLKACEVEGRQTKLLDLMTPKKLEYIINKTKSISYSEQNPKKSISLALKIGHSLQKYALIAKTTAIKRRKF